MKTSDIAKTNWGPAPNSDEMGMALCRSYMQPLHEYKRKLRSVTRAAMNMYMLVLRPKFFYKGQD